MHVNGTKRARQQEQHAREEDGGLGLRAALGGSNVRRERVDVGDSSLGRSRVDV